MSRSRPVAAGQPKGRPGTAPRAGAPAERPDGEGPHAAEPVVELQLDLPAGVPFGSDPAQRVRYVERPAA